VVRSCSLLLLVVLLLLLRQVRGHDLTVLFGGRRNRINGGCWQVGRFE
jgi:hypothetical protein